MTTSSPKSTNANNSTSIINDAESDINEISNMSNQNINVCSQLSFSSRSKKDKFSRQNHINIDEDRLSQSSLDKFKSVQNKPLISILTTSSSLSSTAKNSNIISLNDNEKRDDCNNPPPHMYASSTLPLLNSRSHQLFNLKLTNDLMCNSSATGTSSGSPQLIRKLMNACGSSANDQLNATNTNLAVTSSINESLSRKSSFNSVRFANFVTKSRNNSQSGYNSSQDNQSLPSSSNQPVQQQYQLNASSNLNSIGINNSFSISSSIGSNLVSTVVNTSASLATTPATPTLNTPASITQCTDASTPLVINTNHSILGSSNSNYLPSHSPRKFIFILNLKINF